MYNKVIMIGRLVHDPEIKTTPKGENVCNFRIAVNRPYNTEAADFFDVVAWKKEAEFLGRFFHKGDPIGIDGVLRTGSYINKDGNKITTVEIKADRLFFTQSKSAGE